MTAKTIELTAEDGHRFEAWRADPAGPCKGGIVLLHAVFGRSAHMGDVCAQWAEQGYAAIAPALFDRLARGTVHPYSREGVQAGTQSYAQLRDEDVLADIAACAKALRASGPVIISGFCTGGSWAWRAAAHQRFDAQVNFYASHAHLDGWINLPQRCPTILHYGDLDPIVPPEQVARIAAAHPQIKIVTYPGALHAFMNPEQQSYNETAAKRAFAESLAFLDEVLR